MSCLPGFPGVRSTNGIPGLFKILGIPQSLSYGHLFQALSSKILGICGLHFDKVKSKNFSKLFLGSNNKKRQIKVGP